jgi:Zn-dependent alcohol dehydrogenase
MKAAVLRQVGSPLTLEDVELDAPKADEVRVRIAAAGVCRSDLHFMRGHAAMKMPAVLGHEGSAVVEVVGEHVTRVKPGDHVILSFAPHCGHCVSCLSGHANLCDRHMATGGTMFDGTVRLHSGSEDIAHMGKVACFAEQAVVPETGCIPIAEDFPLDQAALIGCCVTTGVGAVLNSARVNPGSTVAVIGAGGVGLNVAQGARLAGAARVIVVDVNDAALEFAGRFGATDMVNPTHENALQRIRDLTGGAGVDYAFEVFGSAETITMALDATKKGGTAVVIGLTAMGEETGIDALQLVRQEKTLKGSYYGSAAPAVDMHRTVDLTTTGKIDVGGLITRRYRLDEINDAYEELARGAVGRGIIEF